MDLTEFLLARIAEDEAVAQESHYDGQRWLTEEEGVYRWPDDELVHMADRKADARHIAIWDPVRVLAECEAKRRIVEAEVLRDVGPASHYISPEVHARIAARAATPVLCLLALPHADHPDYDPAWRP